MKKYTNIEERHLSFLLLCKSMKESYRRIEEVLGDKNSFKDFIYSLPSEILNSCGYSKNINSLERIEYLTTHILRGTTLELASSTLFQDLPNTKGLEFLTCKPIDIKGLDFLEKTAKDYIKNHYNNMDIEVEKAKELDRITISSKNKECAISIYTNGAKYIVTLFPNSKYKREQAIKESEELDLNNQDNNTLKTYIDKFYFSK